MLLLAVPAYCFFLHPTPRGPDYYPEILKLRLPAEFAFNLVGTGNQDCRITRATWSHPNRDLFSGHATRGLDHVAHAVTITTATEVVDRAPFVEQVERENVRAREVDDVNVIAN